MTKFSLFALALLSTVLVPLASAHADTTPGWYMGAGVGGTFTPDATTRPSTGNNIITFDPGLNGNLNGGYAWTNGLRLEGEVWRSKAEVDTVSGATPDNGELNNTNLFANIYYDFNLGMMMTPYIGAGVGVAFIDADRIGTLTNLGALNDDSTEFAYQAIAGVAAQLDPHWAVSADYRYIGSTEPSFRTTAGGTARTDSESHNVVLSLRYSFGEPTPPPPVRTTTAPKMMPRAAERPVVAPASQSYMVFFDFDRSDLTPEAKRILASAAQDFKRGGVIKVVVTGHTDTMGTPQYNQRLSERRANAVRSELVSLGVNSSGIATQGAGEGDLLVPTNDQVREAQNRRAEIVFGD